MIRTPQQGADSRLQQQPEAPEPTPAVPPAPAPQREPDPDHEKEQPGREINVPRHAPESERPGVGPEIGPVNPDLPESPAPVPSIEVPLPPDQPGVQM